MAGCPLYFAACDAIDDNGCESNLLLSDQYCGNCTITCIHPHTDATCLGGYCMLSACRDFYGDCNLDPNDGCEIDLQTSDAFCGGCTNPGCDSSSHCVGGACVPI